MESSEKSVYAHEQNNIGRFDFLSFDWDRKTRIPKSHWMEDIMLSDTRD